MATIETLMIEMKFNSYSAAQRILDIVSELCTINKLKHTMYRCFCTDIIDNVDVITLQELAYALQVPINLPNKTHKNFYISLKFHWGVIIILQKNNVN